MNRIAIYSGSFFAMKSENEFVLKLVTSILKLESQWV